jgi:hypothetical protein
MAIDDATHTRLLEVVTRDGEELHVAFIDHYSTRPQVQIFREMGWFEEEDAEDMVIPGLFQPLVIARRNLNVGVRLLGPANKDLGWEKDLYVAKSDGDQDRPS